MIKINEKFFPYQPGQTLFQIRDSYKSDADILIYNGFQTDNNFLIEDESEITLIKRGEIPSEEELESLMISRHTPGIHNLIRSSVVGIAGVGGLGSSVAVALARIGVGKLVLVDFDIVEPSNLNRQQYFTHQIGEPKVEAMKGNLEMINPFVTVEIHQTKIDENNIATLFSEVDVLVEAFDKPEMKSMLANSYFQHFPYGYLVMASGVAGYSSANEIVTRKVGNRLFIVGDAVSAAKPGQGLMAPRVGVAAHHQANQVLNIILQEKNEVNH